MGPLAEYLVADHRRLDALLQRSMAVPGCVDMEAFEAFRGSLLRHIGIEEKILLPDARRRRGGEPLPIARRLRIEHGAIASLLVPTPTVEIVREIGALLSAHEPLEEGPGGVFDACERLAGGEIEELLARIRAAPEVPLAPHFDGHGVCRTAAEAIEASSRARARAEQRLRA